MIYTVGHSTMQKQEFLHLVSRIDEIWDIRSHPGSRWEQFRKEEMEQWLPDHGIDYLWVPQLGGWRSDHEPLAERFKEYHVDIPAYVKGKFPKQRISKEISGQEEPYWYNQGLWDFQFFMTLDEFFRGVDDLVRESRRKNIGIMCCECLWWKCHRSMVADYLVHIGYDAVHLQPKYTLHSDCIGNRLERYHPHVLGIWN